MYNLKGFIEIDALASSTPGAIAILGQLSTKSMTYSTTISDYSSGSVPSYMLSAFTSANASGNITVPAPLVSQVFSLVDWVYKNQLLPTAATTATNLVTAIAAQYGSNINSIACGTLISNGTVSLPEYISWVNPSITTGDPTAGATVKIWFADRSFQNQYDGGSITILPPIPSLSTFFSGAATLANAVNNYSYTSRINAVQTASAGQPATTIVPITYNYVDPTNPSNRIATNWTALIYGQAGNTVDALNAAVRSYIAANSQQSQSSWQAILPDLYNSTEFYILPRWQNVAIPSLSVLSGSYSSIVQPYKELNYVARVFTSMSQAFIQSNLAVLPTNYDSLEILVIGASTNPTSEQNVWTLFPDIINVPTEDTAYNTMSATTRAWLSMIVTLLNLAETATANSTLPSGVSRATRNNVLFLSQMFQGVNYLVATKASSPSYA